MSAAIKRIHPLESKILKWLGRTPATAERLTLLAVGMPDHTLMELQAEEAAKLQPAELAQQMFEQSQEWAEGSDRECRFVAQWWRAEAPCLTLQYRAGQSYTGQLPGTNFDGTVPDILAQMQRHIEAKERTMTGAIKTVLDAQNYVIERQRLELEDMRALVARTAEREEALRQEELASIVEDKDDERAARLFNLGIEVVKQLQSGAAQQKGAAK